MSVCYKKYILLGIHTCMYVQLMCVPLLECYPVNRSYTEAISGVSGIVTHMVVEKGMGHKGG